MIARFWQIGIRILAPAAAAFALVSVLTPDTDLQHDLVLIAPERAQPGTRVPLRAFLYAGLHAPEGPRLARASARVELAAGAGPTRETIATTTLAIGHGPSLEGALLIPERLRTARALPTKAPEALWLIAHARIGDESIRVERPLEIAEPERPTTAPRSTPRALRALQQLSLGPVSALGAEPQPSSMHVRVAGGACVPEEPCDVLVHVGEPASELSLEPTPSVTLESRAPQTETPGVVALRVRVHGPEAELRLLAKRGGVPVAARSVRVPVALGSDAMLLTPRVLREGQSPLITLLGIDPSGIADVFARGSWLTTRSVTAREPTSLLLPRETGLFRAQLRRDPFESHTAAAATFYVRKRAESDAEVLATLARAVLEVAPSDALARKLSSTSAGTSLSNPDAASVERSSAYLLAALDDGLYHLPEPTSGYPRALARAAAQHAETRKLALIVIALAAASLVLVLVQRGLAGSAEATSVLRASGVGRQGLAREKARMTIRLIAVAVSVLLAFFAIALYLIARGSSL